MRCMSVPRSAMDTCCLAKGAAPVTPLRARYFGTALSAGCPLPPGVLYGRRLPSGEGLKYSGPGIAASLTLLTNSTHFIQGSQNFNESTGGELLCPADVTSTEKWGQKVAPETASNLQVCIGRNFLVHGGTTCPLADSLQNKQHSLST